MADKKVYVELAARCLWDGEIREQGDIVEMDAELAKDFGKVVKTGTSATAESKDAAPAT